MSCSWLEFRWLDTSYSWLHPTADSSSGGWIWLKANSILWLTMSCGWLELRLTRVPAARYELQLIPFDLWLTHTLIYQVNLRTYSANYIIFIVCFLPPDFSYHWFRLYLLLEEAWRSFKTLAATDSSCSSYSSCDGWFETSDQSTNFRILTPMPPDKKHW